MKVLNCSLLKSKSEPEANLGPCQVSLKKFFVKTHCAKRVLIRSYSGPYFPAFGLNMISPYSVRMRENTEQSKSEYRHFSRSGCFYDHSWVPLTWNRRFWHIVNFGKFYHFFTEKFEIFEIQWWLRCCGKSFKCRLLISVACKVLLRLPLFWRKVTAIWMPK